MIIAVKRKLSIFNKKIVAKMEKFVPYDGKKWKQIEINCLKKIPAKEV